MPGVLRCLPNSGSGKCVSIWFGFSLTPRFMDNRHQKIIFFHYCKKVENNKTKVSDKGIYNLENKCSWKFSSSGRFSLKSSFRVDFRRTPNISVFTNYLAKSIQSGATLRINISAYKQRKPVKIWWHAHIFTKNVLFDLLVQFFCFFE